MSRIASVLLPMPLPEAFDYAEPDGLDLSIGDHVAVPLGPRVIRGVVVALRDGTGGNRPLKVIQGRVDDPPLPPGVLAFVEWAARYSVDLPGWPLAMALRGLRHPPPKPDKVLVLSGTQPARMTPARLKVLAAAEGVKLSGAALASAAGVSAGVVKGLVDEGVLVADYVEPERGLPQPDLSLPPRTLNPGQAACVDVLKEMLDAGGFQAALLDGVTGSGKTEVYLEAVASGNARIVVGARSALFLPFKKLRLIVVDEEHDSSFKQEEGFIYQARDLAVARAKIEGASVLLASATPSLESLFNAQAGRYRWLRLSARHGAAQLPDIDLVDMRQTPPEPGRWLSPPLIKAMAVTLQRGEQAMLFLNRRGYAPLVLCKACGEKMKSPDTDSWLVEHRYTGRLVCHLTGFSMKKPEACPHCGAKDSLVSIGPGVERVEEEARHIFPDARIAVFSSDTVMDAEAARTLVATMAAGEIDILVATQAAAKGHNFPNLTLVGVVDADLSLRGGDLRAGERTFQLLAQAAGRAGRHEKPGRALLQTYSPDHAVMQALKAQDRDAFIEAEMGMRQDAGLPPYGRLAAVIASGPDAAALEAYVDALAAVIPNAEGVEVFGPADAPLALVRGRRRKRFLVRAERNVDLQGFMAAWRARAKVPNSVRVVIDVDPYSFL
jgi:primosomal protein N' (replication factor Y)